MLTPRIDRRDSKSKTSSGNQIIDGEPMKLFNLNSPTTVKSKFENCIDLDNDKINLVGSNNKNKYNVDEFLKDIKIVEAKESNETNKDLKNLKKIKEAKDAKEAKDVKDAKDVKPNPILSQNTLNHINNLNAINNHGRNIKTNLESNFIDVAKSITKSITYNSFKSEDDTEFNVTVKKPPVQKYSGKNIMQNSLLSEYVDKNRERIITPKSLISPNSQAASYINEEQKNNQNLVIKTATILYPEDLKYYKSNSLNKSHSDFKKDSLYGRICDSINNNRSNRTNRAGDINNNNNNNHNNNNTINISINNKIELSLHDNANSNPNNPKSNYKVNSIIPHTAVNSYRPNATQTLGSYRYDRNLSPHNESITKSNASATEINLSFKPNVNANSNSITKNKNINIIDSFSLEKTKSIVINKIPKKKNDDKSVSIETKKKEK